MEFQPITFLRPTWLESFSSDQQPQSAAQATDLPFADVFRAAVENVKQTDAEKNEMEYLLATGQLDNPAKLTIAATQASLSVDLLVQLRNKAVESYNSVMQMNL